MAAALLQRSVLGQLGSVRTAALPEFCTARLLLWGLRVDVASSHLISTCNYVSSLPNEFVEASSPPGCVPHTAIIPLATIAQLSHPAVQRCRMSHQLRSNT